MNETKQNQQEIEQRFLALVGEHSGILRKVAGAYSRNAEDRRDLVQDMHVQLWRAFPRYDAERKFSTWMYRIALNVAISNLRQTGPRDRLTRPLNDGAHDPKGGIDAIDARTELLEVAATSEPAEIDDRVSALDRFIAKLDPLNRAILILYLEEQSHREIADVLGISESNVGTKIHRLKQRIRDDLAGIRSN